MLVETERRIAPLFEEPAFTGSNLVDAGRQQQQGSSSWEVTLRFDENFFAFEFGAGGHDLRLADAADEARASAIVHGPLLALIDLMEGRRDGDALFFVATGEPDGSHYFSASLEEHNAAVARYLERLRSNN